MHVLNSKQKMDPKSKWLIVAISAPKIYVKKNKLLSYMDEKRMRNTTTEITILIIMTLTIITIMIIHLNYCICTQGSN